MEAIKDTIKDLMRNWETRKKLPAGYQPEALLRKVLTKKELGHIKFNYFKKGILNVYVDSSSWLYNLTLQKEALLARLSVKAPAIKDIRFRLGEIK